MKVLTFGFLAAGCAVVFCGCVSPRLAQGRNGQEEEAWQQSIHRSYPGNRAPQVAPTSIVDHFSPKLGEPVDAAAETDSSYAPMTAEVPGALAPSAASTDPENTPAAAVDAAAAKAVPIAVPADAAKASPELKAPAVDGDTYVVKAGDTLGGIAKKFYGDARCYDIILKANSTTVKSPKALRPGMKLVIPKL